MSIRLSQALLILMVVLLFSASSTALSQSPTVPDTVFSDRALDIQVSGTNFTFSSSQVNETISIGVKNPTDMPLDVYSALYKNGEWTVGDKIGTVAPRSTGVYELVESFSYSGRTTETDRMGVLGWSSSAALGNEFFIEENWGAYEDYLKSSLSFFGVLSAGLLLGILLIIMAGVYAVPYNTTQHVSGQFTQAPLSLICGFPIRTVLTTPTGKKGKSADTGEREDRGF